MVYYKDTLNPLHHLTDKGEEFRQKLLEQKADELLFKHKHPIKYWCQRLINWIISGNFTWTGPKYSEQEKFKDGFSYSGFQN